MPRHPRIALTSRLRVHTTNDNTGSASNRMLDTKLGRAVYRGCFGVVENRSAFVVMNVRSSVPQPALQLVVLPSEPTPHGIDLKKPFTMSNIGSGALTPSLPVSTTGIRVLFIIQDRCRLRDRLRPSVAAKLRLVGALRSAGRSRCRSNWWSLSGSNR